jgi:hypothetical protein
LRKRSATCRAKMWTGMWTGLSAALPFVGFRWTPLRARRIASNPMGLRAKPLACGDAGGGTRTPDTRIMIPRVADDNRPSIKVILGLAAECGHEFGHICQPLCTAWRPDRTSGTSRAPGFRSASNSSASLKTRRSRRCVLARWGTSRHVGLAASSRARNELSAPRGIPPTLAREHGTDGMGNRGPARSRRREDGGGFDRWRTRCCCACPRFVCAPFFFVLAGRNRVGARSEDEVRRALAPLRTEGWRLRHSLQWRGRGDIDLVAIAPWGVAFALEAKTSRYEYRHLASVREQAAWLWRSRRSWCRHGMVPVLCVARARGLHRWEDGVLVASIDRLVPTLLATSYPIESVALPF